MFILATSYLTTSHLPWFMDLTFQVPVRYCSLQHFTLLPSPVKPTAGHCFCFVLRPEVPTKTFQLLLLSHQVVSSSPHGVQHTWPPCPSPSPGVFPSSCPLYRKCHPTISSSSPAFNLSQLQDLFQWIGSLHQVAKILELQLQHPCFQWVFRVNFLEGWLVWSACCPQDSRAPQFKIICCSALWLLYCPALTTICDYWKTTALTLWTFVSKAVSLLFNTLSRFVIAFLPRSICILISWLQSPSTVILEPKKEEICHCFHPFPFCLPWSAGARCNYVSLSSEDT